MRHPAVIARAAALALVLIVTPSASAVFAAGVSFTGVVPAEAHGGLDAVALARGQRIKGEGRFTVVLGGLQWRFASAANKAAFLADPARYGA